MTDTGAPSWRAPASRPCVPSVPGAVDHLALGDPGHHGAELLAHLLDLVGIRSRGVRPEAEASEPPRLVLLGVHRVASSLLADLERLQQLDAEREARFEILDEIGEAFKDELPEEAERQVALALAAARARKP